MCRADGAMCRAGGGHVSDGRRPGLPALLEARHTEPRNTRTEQNIEQGQNGASAEAPRQRDGDLVLDGMPFDHMDTWTM